VARALTLANGNILVGLDEKGQVRDFYYPYIGYENHVGGHLTHRIGIWVDGVMSWMDESSWDIEMKCKNESLSGIITAIQKRLNVQLSFHDVVYNEKNIFIRKITVKNLSDRERKIKLFFYHQFEMYESHKAHTAYYDPIHRAVLHYRNKRVFLINAIIENIHFNDYGTGIFHEGGYEGTFRDADDGSLSKNPIEHGSVDSSIGIEANYNKKEEKEIYYWICVAESIDDAVGLNSYILDRGAEHLITTTDDFWHAWVNKRKFTFEGLDTKAIELFKKSLLIVRSHTGNNGSIIASSDSSMLQGGKDTYSYVWPRDASYCASSLQNAGDITLSRSFFQFASDVITPGGYMMHKYSPDKSLGSSWHPWVRDNVFELPIQEDETAIVLHALWEYYEISKDLEFIEKVYDTLIKSSSQFLMKYRDSNTKLPLPTYDLWEERLGSSSYTSASVYGALKAAEKFAKLLGKLRSAREYGDTALEIKEGILKYLYDNNEGYFYKAIYGKGKDIAVDKTVDISSVYGMFYFGVLDPTDDKITKAIEKTESKLMWGGNVGGVGRYEGDRFYARHPSMGNPWIVTTLWLAQYYIAKATGEKDFDKAKELIEWVTRNTTPTCTLPEQIDPYTGKDLSASPLIWSHAEFVRTIVFYLDKMEELGLCLACDPVK
jgi:oligosaccharide amylase